jgi:EAL domain-containing protein (putative c-di-GMP-specific phosphodiesterase class I)
VAWRVAQDGGKGRVLIVDDDDALRAVYAESLRDAGYRVDAAAGGREAIDQLQEREYDTVLSDILMPGMSGIDLVRAVRELEMDTPVILMTGNPGLETALQALEHGVVKYLLKPIAESDLRRAVDEAVRLKVIGRLKREALLHLGRQDWEAADAAALHVRLNRALASLRMVYQPILQVSSGAAFGYEALVRTGERSLPNPIALFEAAERLARVTELGRAIRARVAADASPRPESLFVNVHAAELSDESLYIPPPLNHGAGVVLEITERASLEGVPDVRQRIGRLRELGFRIAVDDFGAGYSGLTSFALLEPEVVKLDMALVRSVDLTPVKRRLIGSMVAVCKEMGTLVVAEGVETEAERATLVDLGCDLLQGFLVGPPAEGH